MADPAIVELARAAVRRLVDAAPGVGDARDALARIERIGLGPPYTVVVAGEPAARSELLDALAGERLFDPARHDPARIVLQLRRGPATALRARRRDGSVEDRALDAELTGEPAAPPRRRAGRHDDRAATVSAGGDPAFQDAIVLSAEAETLALVRSPPWWAVWRRVALWWRAWRARRSSRGAPLLAPAPGPAAPPPRRGFANTVARKRAGDPRQDFIAALAACLADDAVEKLFVEIAGGLLPDKVVVIELPSGASAWPLDAAAPDACLVACAARGFAMTEQLETVLAIVPHVFAIGFASGGASAAEPNPRDPRVRRLPLAGAAARLVQLATLERALAVGQRAAQALAHGSAELDAAITRAETGFRARLDRLEALRIASPDGHVAAALAQVRPAVVAAVQQLLRHALDQLDAAIAELGAAWSAQLAAAGSTDALRTAAAQIDDQSPAALQVAREAALRTLIDGLTERARAHYHELTGALRRGAARDDAAAPPWLTAEVEIAELTSSTSLGAVAPRLTSLFRSLDALRADAVTQLDQRITRLRQVAAAGLLDAEPRLEPAVTGALAIALRGEVERHVAWLDAELARVRIATDAERAQLAVLAIARDTARSDERELVTALDALAAELP
ncbi:MAG TPA: hypothetical protein VHW23_01090 [Kofleriaceae bacterium]|nr:hypothetical protein [Kofleriaceae bacterium]